MAIAAVVVHHNQPELAQATCLAVTEQSVKPNHKILVNVGAPAQWNTDGWLVVAIREDAGLDLALEAAIQELGPEFRQDSQSWLWLLHDDSTPEPTALAELLATAETAPSAAMIGPKLLQRDRPSVIQQLGLTLTKTGSLFVPVRGELDQSQHDQVQESLAVSTAGALVAVSKYLEVDGLAPELNPLAADLDLGVRLRLAGYRVLLAPKSRVLHDGLALAGNRPKRWLGSKPANALLKSQIQLRYRYLPIWLAIPYAILLPLFALVQSALLFLAKHPERILGIWSTSLWGFFSSPVQLPRVRKLSGSQRKAIRVLWPLLAGRAQIARAQRARLAPEQVSTDLDGTTAGNSAGTVTRARFFEAGGVWVMALLAALSWPYWPSEAALVGGGALPLSETWSQLFERAGSSWQLLGNGFAAPSDPFNWVLLALGSITFLKPTLALTWFVFLAKPLAFWGAFRALAQTGSPTWLTAIGALGYAFLPPLSQAQNQGQLAPLTALILIPWFVFVLSKLLNFGDEKVKGVQTWSWIGAAGLLAAAISASAPSVTPLATVLVIALSVYRFRKLGYLIWIPIPLIVLWLPSVWFSLTTLKEPIALITDPGPSVQANKQEFWQLLLGGETNLAYGQYGIWLFSAVAIVALLGLLGKRFGSILMLWLGALLAVTVAWLLQSIQFPASNLNAEASQSVSGSPLVHLGVAGLLLLVAALLSISNAPRGIAGLGGWVTAAVVLTLAAQFTISPAANLIHTDGRQTPAIVQAQSRLQPDLRILVLQPKDDGEIAASLIPGQGVTMESLSVAYRHYLPTLVKTQTAYQQLGSLTADLVAANGNDLTTDFEQARIGYVLVVTGSSASELAGALDSVKELESVGVTQFGQLWRVSAGLNYAASLKLHEESKLWSVTKGVQVAVLAAFALLALPTRRRGSRASSNSDLDTDDLFATEEAN